MNSRKIIIGSVIGGAVGAVAATLLSSKRARLSICDIVEEYSDKVKCAVNGATNFDFSDVGAIIKDKLDDLPAFDNADFVKGIVLGAVIGSGAAMLMRGNKSDISFKSVAKQFTNLINDTQDTVAKASSATNNITHDILDLAHAGLKCWNKLTK